MLMKNLIFSVLLVLASLSITSASTQPSTIDTSGEVLLTSYLKAKDALVLGNVQEVNLQANIFLTTLSKLDGAKLSKDSGLTFKKYKIALTNSGHALASAKDIIKQRTAFAPLSETFFQLIKQLQINTDTLYYQFCPMKKAYWLSTEEKIENPYYGKQMMTCGKVTEILNPAGK